MTLEEEAVAIRSAVASFGERAQEAGHHPFLTDEPRCRVRSCVVCEASADAHASRLPLNEDGFWIETREASAA